MRLIDADELRKNVLKWMPSDPCGKEEKEFPFETDICASMVMEIDDAPTVQPEINCSEIPNNSDTISKQAALEKIRTMQTYKLFAGDDMLLIDQAEAQTELMMLPSVQPEPEAISKWKKEFREYVDSLDITRDDWKGIIEYIEELPSVQPDTTTHDSIPAETGKNDGDGTSGDCISRTQAIDALKEKVFHNLSDEFYGAMQVLDELPSVQPEIIRCKDCKYYKYGICMKIGANKSFYGFCDWAERGEQNG